MSGRFLDDIDVQEVSRRSEYLGLPKVLNFLEAERSLL
jgi:hypothetical protein